MVKSYKSHSFLNGLRFSLASAVKKNRARIIIVAVLSLLAIGIGVYVGICTKGKHFANLQEISLNNFLNGFTGSSSAFFSRCFSLTINVVLLTVLSFSPFLFPLALLLLTYRAYLFGLNFALIFVFYGLGSMFTAVVIILPCQMLTLFVLAMFHIILQRMNCNCKRFGGAECNRGLFVLLCFVLVLLLNLVETLLLCILSGRVIMVI